MPQRPSTWVTAGCALLVLVGGVLLGLPFHHHLALDDWKAELRADGVPARAVVHDQVTKDRGNRQSSSTTMYFRYEVAGRTYEQEVGCVEVCRPAGDVVSIWVNPADPGDFVTDFDELSGHRGRVQGVLGAAGFVILVGAVPLTLSRIPFRRLFARDAPRQRRSAAPAPGVGGRTSRSKHKRGRR